MAYVSYPKDIPLRTKIGTVALTATEADHIYVEFVDVAVNGVKLNGSLHLNRYGDSFSPYRRDPARSDAYSTHIALSASKPWSNGGGDASDAARRKIVDVLVPAVNAWVKDNARIFHDAEAAHLNNKADALDTEIAEAEKKLADLKAKRADLQASMEALIALEETYVKNL